jgi:creatinine amidohydrolase
VVKGENMLEAGAKALANLIIDPETWAAPKDLRLAKIGGVPLR